MNPHPPRQVRLGQPLGALTAKPKTDKFVLGPNINPRLTVELLSLLATVKLRTYQQRNLQVIYEEAETGISSVEDWGATTTPMLRDWWQNLIQNLDPSFLEFRDIPTAPVARRKYAQDELKRVDQLVLQLDRLFGSQTPEFLASENFFWQSPKPELSTFVRNYLDLVPDYAYLNRAISDGEFRKVEITNLLTDLRAVLKQARALLLLPKISGDPNVQ